MKTIILSREDCCREAAQRIRLLLAEKPEAALALAAGRTMTPLFAELARLCAAGELSLKEARLFAVTEFEDCPEALSCRGQLRRELLEKTDLSPENCRFLSAETAEDYEEAIRAAGGLDLAVLGLGDNGHVGYNEPATPYASRTRRQKLTDATRRQLAERFGGEEKVPAYAWTMGIKTLVEAREIFVLAFGEEKARPVHQMLYARDDSYVPAAFLQLPLQVTVWLDQAAAAKI
jgi:glucosamine-6-phosphate deaminase